MLTLYSYDHCPYCMRARMIFAIHDIPYEHKILANDDEQTPIGLIGKKMVPILIKPDGKPMSESMDIIDFIDQYAQESKDSEPLQREVRTEVNDWLANIKQYYNHLVMPRVIRIYKEDFPTQSAMDYFEHKKTQMIGDFAQNMTDSEKYIEQVNKDLMALAPLIRQSTSVNDTISMEDILIFPMLRSLSTIKGVIWPDKVKNYAENMAEKSNMPLLFAQAI